MYTQFFNLKQSPFSIAPDPRYLFMSERHREALAHLLYGVGSGGGFVLLTGEIGAGKTTVCRCFMEQIPENCRLAYIFNPKLTVEELLLTICGEFGIELPPQGAGAVSVKGYVDAINRYLLESHAAGKNNVLIIDEAQNLSAEVLEQLRLLTNLETSERKLLQIILIGQPELREMLARPELEQLAQRVIARYHLGSLTVEETGHYIAHRLAVAGASGVAPFPPNVVAQIHQLTKGVPRRINLLCDRALLGAYVENRQTVNRTIVRKAADEVFAGERSAPSARRRQWQFVAAGVLAGAVLTGAAAWQLMPRSHAPAVAAAAKAPASAPAAALASPAAAAAPPAVAAAGSDAALHELAALWGVTLAPGESCAAAARQNLRCLLVKGGIDELRSLDRPAMLKLRDNPAQPTYAVLTGLNDRTATLSIQGQRQTVSIAELETRFDGGLTTFWRAPRAWRDEVSAGDRGPDVDWLARRLAEQGGEAKPEDNQPLEGATLRKLRDFQASQQLKADGVAGPKTFIRLNQLGGVQEPRLAAK
ncbi:AAA family ATPase [Massilia endophytica]|uniref:AAA family ATPase n=1 Tax=Massilia endophytica TaxID=2899220 RepID=UPI001E5A69A8|nr:AAA family ATPase [Massilia endophytica]UGQ47511.1 AAA family ATPase [Massilia endophytica]